MKEFNAKLWDNCVGLSFGAYDWEDEVLYQIGLVYETMNLRKTTVFNGISLTKQEKSLRTLVGDLKKRSF